MIEAGTGRRARAANPPQRADVLVGIGVVVLAASPAWALVYAIGAFPLLAGDLNLNLRRR